MSASSEGCANAPPAVVTAAGAGQSDGAACWEGMRRRILLASHDTDGAKAAERLALDLAAGGGSIHHLIVVPEFWKGMRGDDWLNNAATQDRFGTYLEDQLGREMEAHVRRLTGDAGARGIEYQATARQGDIAACLVEIARECSATLVVVGSPRPKGTLGFRSRLDLERATRALAVPVLIAPFPAP